MKICVIGYGRHGKDTVSEYIQSKYNLTFTSSSEFIGQKLIYPKYKNELDYGSWQQCFNDRHNHRELWFNEIVSYVKNNKSQLVEDILSEYDIYCGLRNEDELSCAKSKNLFDLILWVDRSKHLPSEPLSSCTVTPEMADYIIDNNSSLDHTHSQVDAILEPLISNQRINH